MSIAKKRALADPEKRERVASAAAENLRNWHRDNDRDWSEWHRDQWRQRREREAHAAAERARWEAMTPFERQLERVRNGARLVEKPRLSRSAPDVTLGGVSAGLL